MRSRLATRAPRRGRTLQLAIALLASASVLGSEVRQSGPFDLVLAGGRVMDPESGLDAIRHVGIRGSQIAAVSATPLTGKTTIDVSGLVVAPGFIDPHAHAQSLEGNRFQARDGVTTALELESGAMPMDDWYRSREGQALLNYGATVGHIYSRIAVMHEKATWEEMRTTRQDTSQSEPDWAYRKASAAEVDAMIARLDRGLADGALGIGMGPAYTPGAGREELLRVFELAARRKALAFIHMRSAGEVEPGGSIDALQEVLANVAATGASVHIVHIGSMGLRQTPRLLGDDRRRARTRPRRHDRGLPLHRRLDLPAVGAVRSWLAGALRDWLSRTCSGPRPASALPTRASHATASRAASS